MAKSTYLKKEVKNDAEFQAVKKIKKEFGLKDKHFFVNEGGHVVKVVSDQPEPHYKLANVLRVLKLYDESIEEYKKALEIDPQYFEASINLGSIYLTKKQYNLAIREFKKTLKLAPDYYIPYYNLALCYEKKDKTFDALWHYTYAMTWGPYFANVYYKLAALIKKFGISKRIIDLLERYLELSPSISNDEIADIQKEIQSLKSKLSNKQLRENRAVLYEKYQKLEQDSNNYDSLIRLGKMYFYLKDCKRAAETLVKASELNPKRKEAWLWLGHTSALLDSNKYRSMALQHLAAVYFLLNKHDRAIQYYEKALEISPCYLTVWEKLGNMHAIKKNYRDAIECYQEVIRHNSMHSEVWTSLSAAYFYVGKYRKAFQSIFKAIDVNPQNMSAWITLRSLYNFKRDIGKATLCNRILETKDPRRISNFIEIIPDEIEKYC